MGRGILVAFEGCDKTGKSTVIKAVSELLGNKSSSISFPNKNGVMTPLLNGYLNKTVNMDPVTAHLLFASERSSSKDYINQELYSDKIVLVDRYIHSGIAYSMANGLDRKWCESVESQAVQPDLVIYLYKNNISGLDNTRFETPLFQKKVTTAYKDLLSLNWEMFNTSELTGTSVSDSESKESVNSDTKLISNIVQTINFYLDRVNRRIDGGVSESR